MVWSTNVWTTLTNRDRIPSVHRSTSTGRRQWDFSSSLFRFSTRGRVGFLSTDARSDFVQVQDQWCIIEPQYDSLRDRYRRDMRNRGGAYSRRAYLTVPMLAPDWRPRSRGAPLTEVEKSWLFMRPEVTLHNIVHVNKVQFRTRASQQHNRHDDTVIKTWYVEDGVETTVYGIIQTIITHSMYSGGPSEVFVEVEWLEPVLVDDEAFLPQVRHNPDSPFNLRARWTLLKQCAAYNIMLAPHNPWDGACGVYDVIDRWRTYEDHSL